MAWDQFTSLWDYEWIDKLRDKIWQRILVVHRDMDLPRVFVPGPDDWFYQGAPFNLPPVGSNHYRLTDNGRNNDLGLNWALKFWIVEYPYEISTFGSPDFPPNTIDTTNPYARFIWKEGISQEQHKQYNLKLLRWSGTTWEPIDPFIDSTINPTVIRKLRRPQQGDYVAQFWKNMIEVVDSISVFFFDPFGHLPRTLDDIGFRTIYKIPPRTRPLENSQFGPPPFNPNPWLNNRDFGRIYRTINNEAVYQPDLVDPQYLSFTGRPASGDYLNKLLIDWIIDRVKAMKYSSSFTYVIGRGKYVSRKIPGAPDFPGVILDFTIEGNFNTKTGQGLDHGQLVLSLPIANANEFQSPVQLIPGNAYDTWSYGPEGPLFSPGVHLAWYISGTLVEDLRSNFPIGYESHPMMYWTSTNPDAVHGTLGHNQWVDVDSNFIDGQDFAPPFDDWNGATPRAQRPFGYEVFQNFSSVPEGYVKWFFDDT